MKKRAAQSIHQVSPFWPDTVGTRRVVQPSSARNFYLDPERRFSIVAGVGGRIEALLKTEPYAAALAFVNGEISIEGDLVSAIRFFLQQPQLIFAKSRSGSPATKRFPRLVRTTPCDAP